MRTLEQIQKTKFNNCMLYVIVIANEVFNFKHEFKAEDKYMSIDDKRQLQNKIKDKEQIRNIDEVKNGDIVLMGRLYDRENFVLHVGIYIDGNIHHSIDGFNYSNKTFEIRNHLMKIIGVCNAQNILP